MRSYKVAAVSLAILLSSGIVGAKGPSYQKGTLTIANASGHKSYT